MFLHWAWISDTYLLILIVLFFFTRNISICFFLLQILPEFIVENENENTVAT